MTPVICFGEALVDFISDRVNGIQLDTSAERFSKHPGGAPANVAAAIARLGGETYFIGGLSNDMFGKFLRQILCDQGIRLDFAKCFSNKKTALAFVSLDSQGERSFSFYREATADLCFSSEDFQSQAFNTPGIFHFCSNTLTNVQIRAATEAGISLAKTNGFTVSFDINLRENLWNDRTVIHSTALEFIHQAQVLKFSREEFDFFKQVQTTHDFCHQLLSKNAKLIVITDGGGPIQYFTAHGTETLPTPQVKVHDTTGAGDAFSGGLLFSLSRANIHQQNLVNFLANEDKLRAAINFAARCGAYSVTLPGAMSSLPRLENL